MKMPDAHQHAAEFDKFLARTAKDDPAHAAKFCKSCRAYKGAAACRRCT